MPSTDKAVVVDGIGKSFGSRSSRFAASASRWVTARWSACWVPNGAGKTTMVDILSTLTKPDRGRAEVAGHDVVSDPAGVRRSIMLTGQQVALDDMLTGRENLVMFGRLQGLKKSAASSRADGTSRPVRPGRCGRPAGQYVFRRDATADRHRLRTGGPPGSRLPGRAHHRTGSAQQAEYLGARGRLQDAGITTLLTTQYLEEADALSDRIIVIDHGTIIAEGTADELKERTGATYCEIVPRHLDDLPAAAGALGLLLPENNRAAVITGSDRVAIPAADGPNTLLQALHQLNEANIELLDIALRRPSLDEVFFALTNRDDSDESAVQIEFAESEHTSGRTSLPHNGDESATHVDAESIS